MNDSSQRAFASLVTTFVVWLGSPHVAFGAGSAPIPLKVLVSNADAVVVAKILDGTVASQMVNLSLDVQKVLKGPLQTGAVLQVDSSFGADAVRYTTAIEKDRGIFFLKSANEKWFLLPVTSGTIAEFRRAFFVLPAASRPKGFGSAVQPSVHERVLAELAGALESGDVRPRGGTVDFMWEYRSDPSTAMKALFAQFASSPNPQLKAAGLRVFISNGDVQAFAQVEKAVATRSANDLAQIAEEIWYYIKATDSRAVTNLGRLAGSQSSPAELRKASLTALARIHTRESLPYLAGFLDGTDLELQTLAVGGIAMFANNVPAGEHEPAPGPWKYRTEDTLRHSAMDPAIKNSPGSVAFWKAWWADHRAELGVSAPPGR